MTAFHHQRTGHKGLGGIVVDRQRIEGVARPLPHLEMSIMSDIRQTVDEEPMGIVISRGSRAESTPRFSAYVWSQAGDAPPTLKEPRAA